MLQTCSPLKTRALPIIRLVGSFPPLRTPKPRSSRVLPVNTQISPHSTAKMADTKAPITRFKQAMSRVYGPLDNLTPEQAKTWTAPASPGAGGHHGRYLWTDGFGVVDFITLYKETTEPVYLELAKSLVRTVHDILGRTRDGVTRLPGATDERPLDGGLRIGKLDEGGMDGDGQYHHYLTVWMFALNRLAVASEERHYNDLAVQLAQSIQPYFVFKGGGRRARMVWKVSTDLRSVLVNSEGHLDGATGYAVYNLLQRTAAAFGQPGDVLKEQVEEYREVMNRGGGRGLSPSADTLDLGMGLWMAQLMREEEWAVTLEAESMVVAREVVGKLGGRPASRRLAFREFGFCMGVRCWPDADEVVKEEARKLVLFWQEYAETRDPDYGDSDLRPISLVMYAAAMIPGGKSPFRCGVIVSILLTCVPGPSLTM